MSPFVCLMTIRELKTQYLIKNLQGHSIQTDIFAVDEQGRKYNIEVQRENKGAKPKRARYNNSLMDANTLQRGEAYEELPEAYVIFITENDVRKKKKPVYRFKRIDEETGEAFGDNSYIVYVNGKICDETPLGQLMHDFSCTKADDMHYEVLADRVRYLKETKEDGRCVR